MIWWTSGFASRSRRSKSSAFTVFLSRGERRRARRRRRSPTRPLRTTSPAARGNACGAFEREPAREQRRERGRVRAAGPVRRSHLEPLDGDLDVPLAVEQMVNRIAVPARLAGPGTERDEPLRKLPRARKLVTSHHKVRGPRPGSG